LKFLQYITSNNVSVLFDGNSVFCFPNGKGGIVDDLLVYRYNTEKFLLVVNAANIEKDWNWCVQNAERLGLKPGKDIINASDGIAQLAVQGPLALSYAEAHKNFSREHGILHILRFWILQESKM